MSTEAIEVAGGSAGISVHLEAVTATAATLRSVAGEVADHAPTVLAATGSPMVLATIGVLPDHALELTSARVALLGSGGPLPRAVALESLGAAVAAAVHGYRASDAAAARLWDGASDALGFGVGVGVGVLTVPTAVAVGAAHAAGVPALPLIGEQVDELAFRFPLAVEAAGGGVDGVVAGVAGSPLLWPVMAAAAARAGVPWPPRTNEEALRLVIAASGGLVLDDSARVTVTPHGPVRQARAPGGVEELMAVQPQIREAGTVRVQRVAPAPTRSGGARGRAGESGGAWIVHLPATSAWNPTPGTNPYDLTTNVGLLAGQVTGTMAATDAALADAKRRHGGGDDDPVMLVGYSQGGITAAALAAHGGFRRRHRVTHVVTAGAPVARVPIPAEVEVLSLEHTQDPVARLEGRSNPERRGWTTVSRSLAGQPEVGGRASAAHGTRHYRVTGREVDASRHPSVASWRAGASRFLGEGHRVTEIDYAVRREVGSR